MPEGFIITESEFSDRRPRLPIKVKRLSASKDALLRRTFRPFPGLDRPQVFSPVIGLRHLG